MNIFTRSMWASVTGEPHCTGVQGDNSEQCGPAGPSPVGAVGPLWWCKVDTKSRNKIISPYNINKPLVIYLSMFPECAGHPADIESEVAQLCLTLCDPLDCSVSGSSVHGILQARILEWVAISFSGESSRPRDQTQVSHIAGRALPPDTRDVPIKEFN